MPLQLLGGAAAAVTSKSFLAMSIGWILADIRDAVKAHAKTAIIVAAHVAAMTVTLNLVKAELFERMQGLPADIAAILVIVGVDQAITIIISAGVGKVALKAAQNGQAQQ